MIERVNRIDEADSSDLEVVASKSFQSIDSRQYIDGKELNFTFAMLMAYNCLDILKPTSEASSTESDEALRDGTSTSRKSNHDRPHKDHVSGDKVEWSSDADPEAAYLAFKNRKSLKRKRAVAESRRARASVADKSHVGTNKKARVSEAIVGRRQNGPEKSSKKKMFGDERDGESDGLNNDQLEEKLPDYIQSRKSKFEKIREKLGDSGLKLPPSYEDIHFSDNELKEQLRQKPVLATLTPCAPYEDIILEYSAGVIPATLA